MNRAQFRRLLRLARHNYLLLVALVTLSAAILAAVFVPFWNLTNPSAQDLSQALLPPVWLGGTGTHPLGTDFLGRDIFSRLVWGTQFSLMVGFSSVALAAAIGIPLGTVSPYFGGAIDELIMRSFDIVLAVPPLLVAIAVLEVFGSSVTGLVLVLGLRGTVYYSRTLRSRVLSIREEQYIEAARAMGLSHIRIMLRHVIPNALAPIVVLSTVYIGLMIILESSLSFLGLTKLHISWGFNVAENLNYVATAWWTATFPGLAIFLFVLSINLIGDFLRDLFDPRLHIHLT